MRVLHLLSTNSFSGAENVVCQIIDMYESDKNIDMVYCSPDGKIRESLRKKNIRFLALEKYNYTCIKDAVSKYNPDIIHAHDVKASIYASLFSKNIKIISHIHGNDLNMRKVTLKSLLYLIVSKKFKHIFWVSDSSLKDYRFYKSICKKSSILVNIVNKSMILKKSREEEIKENFDAIYVGRLIELKNPMRLLKIFSKVITEIPSATIAIIGTGNMYDEIKEYIENNKLDKNIFLLSFKDNPYVYIKKSKMMLLTSIYEGTPMCAVEAMCLGKPVISTPTDGMVNLIEQNVNGFLSNDDNELSEKIINLINNKLELEEMSKNADKYSTKMNDIKKYKKEIDFYYDIN